MSRSTRTATSALCAFVGLIALNPSGVAAQAVTQSDVQAVIDSFHSALASGDSVTALDHLAEDVTILESGGVETKQQYRSGHLAGDMRYAQSVSRERGEIAITIAGDVAWAHSLSTVQGQRGDREINSQSAELMVLAREAGRWKIKAIHWSSRQRR